ncbi:MAG: NAD(P)-dependent dehydrogenase (short-subunit alcohol dehydrogenase family) [Planctomycetota bacterium]|jgi:NAD(P)-dependent dehydrogenase (short-subunit alcohol dehydrogenase family)
MEIDTTMDLLDLQNRVIFISGGCGAIGRVIARELVAHNARVAVNDVINDIEAQAILAEIDPTGERIAYFRADSARPDEVAHALDAVEALWGGIDIVCCHAGMVEAYPVEQYPLEQFDKLIDVNLRAAFALAQAMSKRWIAAQKKGHLLFTTSWVQDVPWPEITPYTTSKAGLKAMMRGYARELAAHGIRANAVAPGIVAVGLAKRQWDTDPSYKARAQKAIPLGFMQPPETVAHAFLYLCSDMAAYATGTVLVVDGGCSLYPMD